VKDRFKVAAKSFIASIPSSCLSTRSLHDEVRYLKRFIACPLGHNAKMNWHASPSDCDYDVAEIALD
jgi:hypothetical protein